MVPTENVKNVKKIFPSSVWKFIQLLKTAWNANKTSFSIVLIGLLIALDQFFKYLASQKNLPNWKIFLNTICNPNLSLSLTINPILFWFGWLCSLIILFFLIYRFKNFFLLLVLAGTLSNLIDRLLIGCVIDYISIWNFPIFNLADTFISLGFFFFIINFKFKSK